MNTPRDWRSERILKVSGSIVREGVFHGHREGSNTPEPSKFTPDVIEKIFKSINGPVPIFMVHGEKGQTRNPIGNLFHNGITPTKDDIESKGMIWDDIAINRINNEGLNKFSPEFDFDYDAQGNIVNARLIGVIPTNSPAISNPPIQAAVTVFDSIGGTTMPDTPAAPPSVGAPASGNTTIQVPIVPGVPNIAPPVPPVQQPVPPAVDPKIVDQMNSLMQQMAANQQVIQALLAERDAMRTGTVNTLVSELKALGISSPETMIQGIPLEAQMNVLKSVKDSMMLRSPAVAAGGAAGANPVMDKQTLENSILKEIGISRKEYDKLMSSPCPSLDMEV